MKKILFIVTIAILIIGTSCKSNNKNISDITTKKMDSYTTITSDEAKAMIDAGNLKIVDVRSLEEYNEGHIDNAILIPLETVEENAGKLLTQKDDNILVYCRSGNRSVAGSEILTSLGYTNVVNLEKGLSDWEYGTVK